MITTANPSGERWHDNDKNTGALVARAVCEHCYGTIEASDGGWFHIYGRQSRCSKFRSR
jgi:hypothetical protein